MLILHFHLFLPYLDMCPTIYKPSKRKEGREKSRQGYVFVFQYKIGFMSVVAGHSAPQVSWVYPEKTFNFCVFSPVPGQEALQGQSLTVRSACTARL